MKILITGAAGFIGYHLAARLIGEGHTVVGVDNLNDYYDVQLKKDRLAQLAAGPNAAAFRFRKLDLVDGAGVARLFTEEGFTHVVNLAAQAGVRYSLKNPVAYVQSNLVGFANVLEGCRNTHVAHLLFASSSSVYGMNARCPYSPHDNVDHPVSLYAATKKSNELMAHAYSHLFRIPCSGLRFFTVYGPWGRPDMSPYLFATAILRGEPIKLFNGGHMRRDFTCIDDIIEGIVRLIPKTPVPNISFDPETPDPATSSAPWRIFNIGNGRAVELRDFIAAIEDALGKKARFELLPMQPGDVETTWADTTDLTAVTGFSPNTPLNEGVLRFIKWFENYYR